MFSPSVKYEAHFETLLEVENKHAFKLAHYRACLVFAISQTHSFFRNIYHYYQFKIITIGFKIRLLQYMK